MNRRARRKILGRKIKKFFCPDFSATPKRFTFRLLPLLVAVISIARLSAQDSVTTIAGSNLVSGAADGPRTNALFSDPAGVVIAPDGTIFVADSANHIIRRIATNGAVTTFAGIAGTNGTSNGTGAAARFDTPTGLALDAAGNLLVTDTGNQTIRKITPNSSVSTLAGFAGESGFSNAVGTAARFNSPLGLCVGSNGTVFVSDSGNHVIRAVTPAGAVSTFAGTPEDWGSDDGPVASAKFNNPVGLALDRAGNLFVADANNHTIRRITPAGTVSTFAGLAGTDGFADRVGAAARFTKPAELAIDDSGNLFVADSFNHLIRQITPAGEVTTVTGLARDDGANDGANRTARLFNPYGLAFSPRGELLVTDTYNQIVRTVFVPFRITMTPVTNGQADQIRLTWSAVVGIRYQVQFKNALPDPAWLNLGATITAPSRTVNTADAAGTGRFYRVIVVGE